MMEKDKFFNKENAFYFINNSCDKVASLCEPLFEKYNFNQFSYMKFFDDGKIFRLVSHKEWSKKFLEQEYYNDTQLFHEHMNTLDLDQVKYVILQGEPHGKHQQELYNTGIWNIAIRFKREKGFIESWAFGTHPENVLAVETYLNEFNNLSIFVSYFKEKMSDSINTENSSNLLSSINFSQKDPILLAKENKPIKTWLKIKKFWIDSDDSAQYLTNKELELITCLSMGKSLKETSAFLSISTRTAECHIQRIKEKLDCASKSEIIDMLNECL